MNDDQQTNAALDQRAEELAKAGDPDKPTCEGMAVPDVGPELPSVDQMMMMEARLMGRPIEWRNGWATTFKNSAGEQRLDVLVYDCAPLKVGGQTMEETRFAIYVNGVVRTGGVI